MGGPDELAGDPQYLPPHLTPYPKLLSVRYNINMAKRIDLNHLDGENAAVLADIVVDPFTPDPLRVQILNKLLEGTQSENFFDTIFLEGLDVGECPNCGHSNHWLIPEDDLNKRGFVTHERDSRVPQYTDAAICPQWQEACKKKKVSI